MAKLREQVILAVLWHRNLQQPSKVRCGNPPWERRLNEDINESRSIDASGILPTVPYVQHYGGSGVPAFQVFRYLSTRHLSQNDVNVFVLKVCFKCAK